jgi:hypothetical protein
VEAVGLDQALRGARQEEARPDFVVLDDIDKEGDTEAQTARKLERIGTAILPALASWGTVLAIQNLVIGHGVFAHLISAQPPFLQDRILSGPHPAVRDLQFQVDEAGRVRITGGEATWKGQSLEVCERQMALWGISAFLREAQHQVGLGQEGLFGRVEFRRVKAEDLPPLQRVVVWVDPAVSLTGLSRQAVAVAGKDMEGRIYILSVWAGRVPPEEAIMEALRRGREWGAGEIGIESDQGGEAWNSVYERACERLGLEQPPRLVLERASRVKGSKADRAARMVVDYERGLIYHLEGLAGMVESYLRQFPEGESKDVVDVLFWAWHSLRESRQVKAMVF